MHSTGWAENWWDRLQTEPTGGNFVLFGAQAHRSAKHCSQFLAFAESRSQIPASLVGVITAVRSIAYWLNHPEVSPASTRHRASVSDEWWYARLVRSPTPRNCVVFGACVEQSEQLCSRFLARCDLAVQLPDVVADIAVAVRAIYARMRLERADTSTRQTPRRRWHALLLTAALPAVFALSIGLHTYGENSTWQTVSTLIGEHRHITLPDGTQAEVNTQTTLRFRYTGDLRSLELVTGELRLKVAHDSRPFVVLTNDISIHDIGTEFSTRMYDNGDVEVRVVEGAVGLDPRGLLHLLQNILPRSSSHMAYSVRVGAGYIARSENGRISVTAVELAELERRDAWRFGRIALADTPFAEAVAEFNRYNRRKIEIADPTLSSLTLGGSYEATQSGEFLSALLHVIPMRITMIADAHGDARVYQVRRAMNGSLRGERLDEIALAFNLRNKTPRFVIEGKARSAAVWVPIDLDRPEDFVRSLERSQRLEVKRIGQRVLIRQKGND